MHDPEYTEVIGDDGSRGYILGPSETNPDDVAIAWDDGREMSVPARSLRRGPNGAWHVEHVQAQQQEVIPVLKEELNVGTRKRTTGTVRVGKTITEHDETVSMPLTRERAQVRRVIIDRPIDQVPPIRREGDTIIFPVVEEVAVVEKRLMLKEELHISRHRTTEQHDQTVTLREEHPAVERIDSEGSRMPLTSGEAERKTVQPRSIIDPSKRRPSILTPSKKTRPARRNKILRDD